MRIDHHKKFQFCLILRKNEQQLDISLSRTLESLSRIINSITSDLKETPEFSLDPW